MAFLGFGFHVSLMWSVQRLVFAVSRTLLNVRNLIAACKPKFCCWFVFWVCFLGFFRFFFSPPSLQLAEVGILRKMSVFLKLESSSNSSFELLKIISWAEFSCLLV